MRYRFAHQWTEFLFTSNGESFNIRLAYSAKFLLRLLFFVPLLVCGSHANSQKNAYPESVLAAEFADLSDAELLKKAESLEHKDPQQSIQLAKAALSLATENNHNILTAQAHALLGGIAENSKDYQQSLDHFSKSSAIYKNLNDKQNQILVTLNYIDVLIDDKNYKGALTFAAELLLVALNYEDDLLIARTLFINGTAYYKDKNYEEAIVQYKEAVSHLSGKSDEIQKLLGNTYKQLAQSYKRLQNREETANYYRKTLGVFTELREKKLMARTLNTLAEAERYLGNYVVALDYSIRGLELHQALEDSEGHAKALIGVGIIYRHIGRYDQSLKHFHEANLYYKKVNDVVGIAKTSNQMGLIYTKLKQFDQARSFFQMTADLPVNEIDLNTLSSAYRELAVIDLNDGKYATAKVMAKKALDIYQTQNERTKESLTTRIIGNIYRGEGDETNAIAFYRKSLALATEVGSKIYQIKAQTPLAGVLINTDVDEAIGLLTKSLKMATEIDEKYQRLYAYRTLIKAEKIKGDIAEALRYAEEEIALTLILEEENEKNQLALEKASLHSQTMEIELESLREKTRRDQLELIRKSNEIEIVGQAKIISDLELTKNRYASIALAALLAICVGLVILTYRRFTDSRKLNRELDYLAARDPLTNCYNRRILFDLMNRDFAESTPMKEYCVVMIDIDHFKDVNDTYGHSAGDSVLRGVATVLQNAVRQNDIVARYGGEEFCIVLPNASQNQAMRIAETIRLNVEASCINDISITCSLGVSSIKFNASSASEIIAQADIALFRSKSLGRNQVTLWEEPQGK